MFRIFLTNPSFHPTAHAVGYVKPMHTHTYTRLTAIFPGLPGLAGTRKVKPIWILLTQETVSGSGISWAICKSAPRSRQITTPAPHHSVFYRPDALPAAQPTASKHRRPNVKPMHSNIIVQWPVKRPRSQNFKRIVMSRLSFYLVAIIQE